MLEKKSWDKRKSEQDVSAVNPNMRQEALAALKKDPVNLAKLRHPSMLNLVEAPGEDDKYLVFVTEPVEFSLACLAEANSTKDHLKDKIPSVLEIKVMILELMEALNFLHQNAKCIHAGISPECLFLTKAGKLKIAGLNFCAPLGVEESVTIPT